MRLGIVLRLVGVLVLGSLVVVEGSALKNRAFEGKTEHYTVVLSSDADINAVAADHAKQGVKVEHTVQTAAVKAYVASMPSGITNVVRTDPRVAYIEMDSQVKVRHNWWDTTMITLGLSVPQFN